MILVDSPCSCRHQRGAFGATTVGGRFILALLPIVSAWHPGDVCTNYAPADRNFLAAVEGKHVRFTAKINPPWAIKDATKTGNAQYTGFNIDLWSNIAAELSVDLLVPQKPDGP